MAHAKGIKERFRHIVSTRLAQEAQASSSSEGEEDQVTV